MIIYIYTDGGCNNLTGIGAWAWVMTDGLDGDVLKSDSGYEDDTTNNRMELMAAIQSLKYAQKINDKSKIFVTSDSKYVIEGITKWIKRWIKRNWKRKDNGPILNQDLWMQLYEITSNINVDIQWLHVDGHTGNINNELCDSMATDQMNILKILKGQKIHV